MKLLARVSLCVVLGLAALLPFATAVGAQAEFTGFTGIESCGPTEMGAWTFPGGSTHIRGLVTSCTYTTNSPLFGGPAVVVLNGNLRPAPGSYGMGQTWGTWEMENWSGTWVGYVNADGSDVYRAQGNGTGPNEGMKISWDGDHGALTGRILDPPRRQLRRLRSKAGEHPAHVSGRLSQMKPLETATPVATWGRQARQTVQTA